MKTRVWTVVVFILLAGLLCFSLFVIPIGLNSTVTNKGSEPYDVAVGLSVFWVLITPFILFLCLRPLTLIHFKFHFYLYLAFVLLIFSILFALFHMRLWLTVLCGLTVFVLLEIFDPLSWHLYPSIFNVGAVINISNYKPGYPEDRPYVKGEVIAKTWHLKRGWSYTILNNSNYSQEINEFWLKRS